MFSGQLCLRRYSRRAAQRGIERRVTARARSGNNLRSRGNPPPPPDLPSLHRQTPRVLDRRRSHDTLKNPGT